MKKASRLSFPGPRRQLRAPETYLIQYLSKRSSEKAVAPSYWDRKQNTKECAGSRNSVAGYDLHSEVLVNKTVAEFVITLFSCVDSEGKERQTNFSLQ